MKAFSFNFGFATLPLDGLQLSKNAQVVQLHRANSCQNFVAEYSPENFSQNNEYANIFCSELNVKKQVRSLLIEQLDYSPSLICKEAPGRLASPAGTPKAVLRKHRQRAQTLCEGQDDFSISLDHVDDEVAISEISQLVARANAGLKMNVLPTLAEGAIGGAYFLRDISKRITVVCKPGDEERNSPNNPYQEAHSSLLAYKGGITPGFGMYREVIACILDGGFCGVPPTAMGHIRHPSTKQHVNTLRNHRDPRTSAFAAAFTNTPGLGSSSGSGSGSAASATSSASLSGFGLGEWAAKSCSVQAYVSNEGSAEDMGCCMFDSNDIHRIGVLDIRLCNLDRHEGNLLVTRSSPYQKDLVSIRPNLSSASLLFTRDVPVSISTLSSSSSSSGLAAQLASSDSAGSLSSISAGNPCTPPLSSSSFDDKDDSPPVQLARSAPAISSLSLMHQFMQASAVSTDTSSTLSSSSSSSTSSSTSSSMGSGGGGGSDATCASISLSPTHSTSTSAGISASLFSLSRPSSSPRTLPKATKFRLVPIDHGFILPHVLHLSETSFAWLNWPQAQDAFTPDVLDYIAALDYNEDVEQLKRRSIKFTLSKSSLLTLRVCTLFLQRGAAAGLTLFDLGTAMTVDELADPGWEAYTPRVTYSTPPPLMPTTPSATRTTPTGAGSDETELDMPTPRDSFTSPSTPALVAAAAVFKSVRTSSSTTHTTPPPLPVTASAYVPTSRLQSTVHQALRHTLARHILTTHAPTYQRDKCTLLSLLSASFYAVWRTDLLSGLAQEWTDTNPNFLGLAAAMPVSELSLEFATRLQEGVALDIELGRAVDRLVADILREKEEGSLA